MLFFMLLALFSAVLFRFIHICLGSPRIEGDTAINYSGMIFSKLGAWVCSKYSQFELSESMRIRNKYLNPNKAISPEDRKFLFDLYGADFIAPERSTLVQLQSALYHARERSERRLNPYKAAFICPPCTCFWFAQPIFWLVVPCYEASPLLIGLGWLFFAPLVLSCWQILNRIIEE